MAKALGKFLGMFDKIDDIIYEPVHLVCDALRQPIKERQEHNDRKNLENANILEMEIKAFEVALELERKKREDKLTAEERRMHEDINQMIMEKDLQRREEMVQLEIKYRKEMAESAVQLANLIANMQVDTRSKVLSLYKQKEEEYLDLQVRYKKEMLNTVRSLQEIFPGDLGTEVIANEVSTQLKSIAERSMNFTNLMNDDMKNIFGIIDDGMKEITGLATKYFQVSNNHHVLTDSDSYGIVKK